MIRLRPKQLRYCWRLLASIIARIPTSSFASSMNTSTQPGVHADLLRSHHQTSCLNRAKVIMKSFTRYSVFVVATCVIASSLVAQSPDFSTNRPTSKYRGVVNTVPSTLEATSMMRRAAGKVMAVSMLIYGKEPTFREMWKWIGSA